MRRSRKAQQLKVEVALQSNGSVLIAIQHASVTKRGADRNSAALQAQTTVKASGLRAGGLVFTMGWVA